jgi:hypothetical protein
MIFSAQPGYRVIAYRLSEDASNVEFDEFDVIAWQTDKNGIVPVTTGDLAIASDEERPDEDQYKVVTPSGKVIGMGDSRPEVDTWKSWVRTSFDDGELIFAHDHDQAKYVKRRCAMESATKAIG